MRLLAILLLVVSAASAADTVSQAAGKVLAAVKAKDAAALKALAEKDQPDPWRVVDELCFRGEHDAAVALAGTRKSRPLQAYIKRVRDLPTDPATRRAYFASLKETDPAKGLERLRDLPSGSRLVHAHVPYRRGLLLRKLGRYREAMEAFRAAERAAHALEWNPRRIWAAHRLRQVAAKLIAAGDYDSALRCYELAWEGVRDAGSPKERAVGRRGLGYMYLLLRRYPDSARELGLAIDEFAQVGDESGRAISESYLANLYLRTGDYRAALELLQSALPLLEKSKERGGLLHARRDIGFAYLMLGDYARALRWTEETLSLARKYGEESGMAGALSMLGDIYTDLGQHRRALSLYEQARVINLKIGHLPWATKILSEIAIVYWKLGELDNAARVLEKSLAARRKLKDERGVSRNLAGLARVRALQGKRVEAVLLMEQSLKMDERLGAKRGEAIARVWLGGWLAESGRAREAAVHFEKSLALAQRIGSKECVASALHGLALLDMRAGRPEGAVAHVRAATEQIGDLSRGLATTEGSALRSVWSRLFALGLRASVRIDDTASALHFVEQGRAAGLLESLGGRKALREVAVSRKLRLRESELHEKESRLQRSYDRAIESGDEVEDLHRELGTVRNDISELVERIQREAKVRANVVYPKAASAEAIAGSLKPGEAMALYAFSKEGSIAVVVEPGSRRVVALGATEKIQSAILAFENSVTRPGERGMARPRHESFDYLAKRLRKLVVEPLALSSATKRLLVSPDGRLAYVPMGLLTEAEVAYIPSATVYGLVRSEASATRGEKVLALGDPDYGVERDDLVLTTLKRGGGLAPLPGSGAEAKAIGDLVLLRGKATIPALRTALQQRTRWRALHFACHGLIDPERPVFSSLALSPGDDDDGFLRCLDVYRMRIPADLAVLSACETGKGKIYKTEGVVGFTHAFLFAGCPRVIVSLWKVDDEATRALMVKFYELWKPGKMATATALKKAQEYVASQEKWKHPYYWAAWQLWGLPD